MILADDVRSWADGLPVVVWAIDADGGLVYLNRHGRAVLDLPEGLDDGLAAALHPDDRERVLRDIERAGRDRSGWETSCRLRTAGADDHAPFLVRGEPVRDDDGRLAGWTGTCTPSRASDAPEPASLGGPDEVTVLQDALRRQRERADLYREFHATLARVTEESLGAELDDAYYGRVLGYAVRLVPGAAAGSLTRRGPDGGWTFVAVVGHDERLLDVRLPPGEKRMDPDSFEPHVVNGYRAGPDLDDATREALYGPVGRAAEIRSSLLVPVRFGGELHAYLNLDNFERPDAFGTDALELGRLFARQIGLVMQRVELERDLIHQAYTDVVTGIPNRRRAEDLLQARLEEGGAGALLFLDLDDFKDVNEAHGHAVGDELLRAVAARLWRGLPDDAVLARWGGDEFLAILPDPGSPEAATRTALEVESALRAPFRVGGHTVSTSGSVGISTFGDGTVGIQQAVLEADIALNRAKRLGKRRAVLFSPAMGAETSRRFTIERALREALRDGGELRVQYQARVDSESCRDVAVEALSRWTHPTLGELSPSEFVPIAEASGLIDELTRRVLDHATRQARAWMDSGTPRLVSVNLSAACIRRESIVDDVREALARYDLPGSLLELEVTETAAMSGMQESVANLRSLRTLGVSLSVDDFGTAYSSLSYLRLLPVDTIKVDRTFVSHLAENADDSPTESSIVKGIIALGRSLGMRVVAEGVETEAQADFLRALGCDGMQGFYFGRAQPGDAFA